MYLEDVFMNERNIDYVPISKFSRGYAGQAIDKMNNDNSVIYIMRNNKPAAVILTFEDYQSYLNTMKSNERINKIEISNKLAGSLNQFADTEKVSGEKDFYLKGLVDKYEK